MTVFFAAVSSAQGPGDNNDSSSPQDEGENIFQPKNKDDRPENYQLRSVDKRRIDSLKSLAAFWYADSSFNNRQKKITYYLDSTGGRRNAQRRETRDDNYGSERRSSGMSTGFLLIILVIALAAIIFLLVQNNVVGKRRITASPEEEQPEETENIFEINYQKEIDKAIADKNYRLAVRLMFLRVLRGLANNDIIQYKQERTNLDYLMQLHSSKYYNEFFKLTRNYEYVWYGKFEPSPETFSILRTEFENFDRKLN